MLAIGKVNRMNFEEMNTALFEQILMARQRVYTVGDETPLEKLPLADLKCSIWAKREDLGPIKAFKWRGAYNAMASLTEEQRAKGIVAASAGNHAQGIALGAKQLKCRATIYMPLSTPEVKQREVLRHGGKWVKIVLHGDSYDDAGIEARAYCEASGANYIHPYNDLLTMGGQGTLADEIIMQAQQPFDRVYVAIGGGGLAASVACWLKHFWPDSKIIGVEGTDQASMKAAMESGEPVNLDYLDVFCDGTAVRKVGQHTFKLCQGLLDGINTVTNDEVCHAIRLVWESLRAIPEPSGAMGLAAALQDAASGNIIDDERVLVIICGANMDFAQLSNISRRAGIGSKHRRYLRLPIPEGNGELANILRELPTGVNVIDVQYGRLGSKAQYPVIGLIGSKSEYAAIDELMQRRGVAAEDVTTQEIVGYRIINYDPEHIHHPLFVNIEFPERPGAFLAFMEEVSSLTSICYFNYSYSGERVGRALVGLDFTDDAKRSACRNLLKELVAKRTVQAAKEVSSETLERLIGTPSN